MVYDGVWIKTVEIESCHTFVKLHIVHLFVYGALRFSEAMNPFIYLIGSRILRTTVMKLFGLKVASVRSVSQRSTVVKLSVTNGLNYQSPKDLTRQYTLEQIETGQQWSLLLIINFQQFVIYVPRGSQLNYWNKKTRQSKNWMFSFDPRGIILDTITSWNFWYHAYEISRNALYWLVGNWFLEGRIK